MTDIGDDPDLDTIKAYANRLREDAKWWRRVAKDALASAGRLEEALRAERSVVAKLRIALGEAERDVDLIAGRKRAEPAWLDDSRER